MKLLKRTNETFNANFTAERNGTHFTIDWMARGGSKNGAGGGLNTEYGRAFEELLERMALNEMIIETIEISSRNAIAGGLDRTIVAEKFPFPINLKEADCGDLRLEIGRRLAEYGRSADAKDGGNSTKRMTLQVSWPSNPKATVGELEDALSAVQGDAQGEVEREFKYAPLGAFLRTKANEDEVVLTFSRIEELVGVLPKTAASHQFWANARDHHLSRRAQWLDNGFNAYFSSLLPGVRFVRNGADVAPTSDEDQLERRVKKAAERFRRNGNKSGPPMGNEEPGRVNAVRTLYERDPNVVAWVLLQAGQTCECCNEKAPFDKDDGSPFLEVHHVRPLGEGGPDTVNNAIACCPNCHRMLHRGRTRVEERDRLIERVPRLVDYPAR